MTRSAGLLVSLPHHAVCNGSPEAPAGGSFECGSSSSPGTVCNGTCSNGGGLLTAECQPTGNWTVQGTCDQNMPSRLAMCVLGKGPDSANMCMLPMLVLSTPAHDLFLGELWTYTLHA
jgi:hypothetical protein